MGDINPCLCSPLLCLHYSMSQQLAGSYTSTWVTEIYSKYLAVHQYLLAVHSALWIVYAASSCWELKQFSAAFGWIYISCSAFALINCLCRVLMLYFSPHLCTCTVFRFTVPIKEQTHHKPRVMLQCTIKATVMERLRPLLMSFRHYSTPRGHLKSNPDQRHHCVS